MYTMAYIWVSRLELPTFFSRWPHMFSMKIEQPGVCMMVFKVCDTNVNDDESLWYNT